MTNAWLRQIRYFPLQSKARVLQSFPTFAFPPTHLQSHHMSGAYPLVTASFTESYEGSASGVDENKNISSVILKGASTTDNRCKMAMEYKTITFHLRCADNVTRGQTHIPAMSSRSLPHNHWPRCSGRRRARCPYPHASRSCRPAQSLKHDGIPDYLAVGDPFDDE